MKTNGELITDMIIEKLKDNKIPWRSPFRGHNKPNSAWLTKKPYRGINAFMTSMQGYRSPYWMTMLQIKKAKGVKLMKGSKGVPILFAKYIDKEQTDGTYKRITIYKRSYVFNLEFIEGIDCPVMEANENAEMLDFKPMEVCDKFLADVKNNIAPIQHNDTFSASYSSWSDQISIGNKELFQTEEDYYSTLFHEMTHSTGHESRCDRPLGNGKKTKAYALEELIAEIGASFMCGHTGILNRTVDDSANYIKSWLTNLRNDPQMIIKASSLAQKAFDYTLNKTQVYSKPEAA